VAELGTQRIATVALRVSDELGVGGVTMRAVAEQLGVTPMALYHHVRDKTALVALMVDRAIHEQPLPAPTGDWREDMFAMAQWMRASVHAHPALAHLRREHCVWTPTMLPMTERWAALWQQSGLPFDDAVLAAAVTSSAIVGAVDEELFASRMDRPGKADLALFPSARQMMSTRVDADVAFELLARSVIDGVYARLSTEGRPARITRRRRRAEQPARR
jgi:AcrR family transcriptional regulator